jgi:hypothetical protein
MKEVGMSWKNARLEATRINLMSFRGENRQKSKVKDMKMAL